MEFLLLAGRLVLAAVFAAAGISKIVDRAGSVRAIKEFGIPDRFSRLLALALPVFELAVAVALVPDISAWWGAVSALSILVVFIAVIATNLARGRRPDCHCFGQLHSAPIGWRTLVRNVILAGVAGLIVWQADDTAWSTALSAIETVLLTAIAVLTVLLAIVGWLALNLLFQHGRLLLRIESLEQRDFQSADALLPTTYDAYPTPALGLPVGSVAPEFVLPRLDGELVTLGALRALGKPVVLLFTDPGCGPCTTLLPDIGRWQHQYAGTVSLTVITNGSREESQAKASEFDLAVVLLQQHHEVATAYRFAGTPSAVVVSTDGLIAGPLVAGADAVRAMLERMVSDLPRFANIAENGHARQDANGTRARAARGVPRAGDPAPTFALRDLAGKTVELDDFRGQDALLLFWNPSCGHCQQMLPDVQEWEQTRSPSAPALVLVSTGSREANAALGLESPVLLDPDGQTMASFGANGTPMAVLIGPAGEIASEPAAGAIGVFRLLEDATNAHPLISSGKRSKTVMATSDSEGRDEQWQAIR